MTFLGIGAFDIDGTLMHHPEKPDYLNPQSLILAKPCPHTCARVRTLIEVGMDIHFITGRADAVKDTTLAQLRAYVHPSIHPSRLHTQENFVGYQQMAAWKASRLKAVKAQWYVGDHTADHDAAIMAGIPFQFATDYHEAAKSSPWAVV